MIDANTIADPRSPWARHAPAENTASNTTGRRLRRTSDSTSSRRTNRSAVNTTTPSLRNSDGWRLNGPTETQARAPLTLVPTPGTNGRTIAPASTARIAHDPLRTQARLIRCVNHSPTNPTAAQATCRLNR